MGTFRGGGGSVRFGVFLYKAGAFWYNLGFFLVQLGGFQVHIPGVLIVMLCCVVHSIAREWSLTERFSCGTCGAPKAKPRSDTNFKNDLSHIMLQITCVPLINSLPADIIHDSFDLVIVQWNRETQTLRRACGAQKAFSESRYKNHFLVFLGEHRGGGDGLPKERIDL